MLNLLGASTTVDGAIVSSDSFALIIVAECTALGPLVMFTGAVVAYPTSHAAKLKGLLLGLAVLTAVNLVRIVSLFWIGSAHPQYLDVRGASAGVADCYNSFRYCIMAGLVGKDCRC